MIPLKRGAAPSEYRMKAEAATKPLLAFVKRPAWWKLQEKPDFKRSDIIWRPVLPTLEKRFFSKCVYCETPLGVTGRGELELFRPKTLYPWLVYEWENFLIACSACNRSKGTRFPLEDEKKRAPRPELVMRERPLLLNPCEDQPDEHLTFDDKGMVVSSTKRGLATIDTLALNRTGLVRERVKHADWLRLTFTRLTEEPAIGEEEFGDLLQLLGDAAPYAGMARQIVKRLIAKQPIPQSPSEKQQRELFGYLGSVQATSVEDSAKAYRAHELHIETFSLPTSLNENVNISYFAKRRTIDRISIENFRALRRLDLRLAASADDAAAWMMVLGENATGKSSLLKAIALTLMGDTQRARAKGDFGISPDAVLTHGARQGRVRIWLCGVRQPVELSFRRGDPGFGGHASEKVLLLGYGSTRRLANERAAPELDSPSPVRIGSLFDAGARLIDVEKWLIDHVPKDYFNVAAQVLKSLLPLRPRDRLEIVRRDGKRRVVVRMFGDEISLSELSDGYQAVLALAADVLSVLLPVWKYRVQAAEGIVLVDELDAHLHPSWRKRIVSDLRRCFPNVQFIATTHDPLCLRGLNEGEVAVLRRGRGNSVLAVRDLPSPAAMTPDQLLTSEHFGLSSIVEPEISQIFREYYQLLAKGKLSSSESTKLAELKKELRSLHYMGQTRREQMMLEVIDAYLAETPPSSVEKQRVRRASAEDTLKKIYAAEGAGQRSAPKNGKAK